MKATMCEIKNKLDAINSRLGITEEKISELENMAIDTIQNEHRGRENKLLNKQSWCPGG